MFTLFKLYLLAYFILIRMVSQLNKLRTLALHIENTFWCEFSCKEMGHVLVHRQEIVEYWIVVTISLHHMLLSENLYLFIA